MAKPPSRERPRLRLFLDEGVPDSVGRAFENHKHEVIYLRDSVPQGSPDLLVCAAAGSNDAVLVAFDGDMRQIAKNHGISKGRFKRLSLIKLSCTEPSAASRIEQAMSFIEHEWIISSEKAARRLFVEIGSYVLRTYR
jgi:predicted nuclease of predicted toxin-antitoxin system